MYVKYDLQGIVHTTALYIPQISFERPMIAINMKSLNVSTSEF